MQTLVPIHESTRILEFASPEIVPPKPMPQLTPQHPICDGSPRQQLPALSPHPPDLQPATLRVSPIQPRGQPSFEDSSDNVAANIPYQAVEPVEEASIEDLTVGNINIGDEPQEVEYKLAGTTEKGKPQLVDSAGYTYVHKVKRTDVIYWR